MQVKDVEKEKQSEIRMMDKQIEMMKRDKRENEDRLEDIIIKHEMVNE